MRIDTLLRRDRVTFSCELFPPKVGADLAHAKTIVREIAALKPDFISVTYGAGGGTSKRTVEIAATSRATASPPSAHDLHRGGPCARRLHDAEPLPKRD